MTVKRAVFDPPPGVILGEEDYSIPGQWCAADKVRFTNGKLQPIGGWENLNASPGTSGTTVSMLEWIGKDGTRRAAVGATGNLVALSGATLSSGADITPVGFVSATRWSFSIWGDHLIACNTGGKVYEWSLAGVAAAVTNAPVQNTIALVTSTRQLMVFGTTEELSGVFNPRCIRFSTTENNTVWATLPSNLAGEYVLDGAGGSIRAAMKIGDYIAVWTDDELFLGNFTGDPSKPWVFTPQSSGAGCLGIDAVTEADGVLYWISADLRYMMWVPGSTPVELPGLPTSYLTGDTSNLDKSGLSNGFVWHNRKFNEIWFHPVTTGNTYPTTYLAANINSLRSNRPIWMPGTLSRSLMYQGINDCYGWRPSITVLYRHESGKHGRVGDQLNWSASALVYFSQGERRVMVKRLLPDIEGQVGTVTVTISTLEYPQGDETVRKTLALAVSDDKKDFRASGKLFRIQFSGSDGTGSTDTFARLGKTTFEYEMLGDR